MKSAADVLAEYDALYKVPNEERWIIDGDEAQLAADLAAVVRQLQQELDTIDGMAEQAAYEQGLEDRPVVDAAVEAVKSELQYAAHEATYGDSKAVQQVDEYLQKTRSNPNRPTGDYGRGFFAGIKATMEHLKRQPR
jgi:hypothetical protein